MRGILMKKALTYLFKLLYLIVSWFVIAYTCYGDINVNLFCISIFTYSGGVAFDSLFYLYESLDTNTILRFPIMLCSILSFVGNFIITVTSLFISKFIIIPFYEKSNAYFIKFDNSVNNGISILYPSLSEICFNLSEVMTWVMVIGIFSLLPAFLLELDSYIRIRNDKYNKK